MKLLSSLLSCVYSGVKLFVFAMSSRRHYIFCVLYLRIIRKELKIRSCLCRLLSAVNVMLNLTIIKKIRTPVCLELGRARSFDATRLYRNLGSRPTVSLRIRKDLSWSVEHIETAVLLSHHNLYCKL